MLLQTVSAQELFQISDPGPKGILLNKGWKYKMGDDTAWALPGYDDRSWRPLNPAVDIQNN